MYSYTLNGWLIFPSFIFFASRGKSFARVHVKLRLYTLENSVARTEISLSLFSECARESVDVLPWRSIRKERGDDLWRNLFKDGGELVCARELVCGEFLFAKMWFIRQRQMVLVFLILRSYDEDDDNEEESEKSSSSSKTSGSSGLGACSTPPS